MAMSVQPEFESTRSHRCFILTFSDIVSALLALCFIWSNVCSPLDDKPRDFINSDMSSISSISSMSIDALMLRTLFKMSRTMNSSKKREKKVTIHLLGNVLLSC